MVDFCVRAEFFLEFYRFFLEFYIEIITYLLPRRTHFLHFLQFLHFWSKSVKEDIIKEKHTYFLHFLHFLYIFFIFYIFLHFLPVGVDTAEIELSKLCTKITWWSGTDSCKQIFILQHFARSTRCGETRHTVNAKKKFKKKFFSKKN